MTDEHSPPDLGWIETCTRDVAEEARDILEDVLREMDLVHNPQLISPYPHSTDDLKWRGYHDRQAAIRMDVAEMMVKRGVLQSAQPFHERGPYVTDHERQGLRVQADEATVRQAHGLLQDRLRGRPRSAAPAPSAPTAHPPASPPPRSSLPKTMQDALSQEALAPTAAPKLERVPREFKEGFFKGAGEHAGKWAMGVVIGIVVVIVMSAFRLWPLLFNLFIRHPAR